MNMLVNAFVSWFGPEIILGLIAAFIFMVIQYVRE